MSHELHGHGRSSRLRSSVADCLGASGSAVAHVRADAFPDTVDERVRVTITSLYATVRGLMRKTGLSLLGDVPRGRHVAFFYERKEDIVEMCVPFLQAGYESNERCAWRIA